MMIRDTLQTRYGIDLGDVESLDDRQRYTSVPINGN